MVNSKKPDQEENPKGLEDKQKPKTDLHGLAPTRIRTIMRSTADAGNVTADGLHLMTKAAEHFIQYLAQNAFKVSTSLKLSLIKYEHVATVVHSQENLDFLQQIVPKKITIRQYLEILANSKGNQTESSSESDTEEDKKFKKKAPKK